MKDFIGFTLNGVRSEDLGIVRVSGGTRFGKNLVPSADDKTAKVPGRRGSYYFGRDEKQTQLNLSIAYDSMTEAQMRQLQQLLNHKEPMPLILDESSYKKCWVLSTQNSKLDYICFSTNIQSQPVIPLPTDLTQGQVYAPNAVKERGRVYKGEGTLSFILYDINAYSTNKYANEYTEDELYEWNDAINLINQSFTKDEEHYYLLDHFYEESGWAGFYVYNPGDFQAMPAIQIYASSNNLINLMVTLHDFDDNITYSALQITNLQLKNGDAGIEINSEIELIRGIDQNGFPTGTVYNDFIASGYFFSLPANSEIMKLNISGSSVGGYDIANIAYDYLFNV